MEDDALDKEPAATTDTGLLTADIPGLQNEAQSKSATVFHTESKISNIPPPPGGNIKTKTNIATIKYPQFSQQYLGFELSE